MKNFTYLLRVRYSECDAQKVVFNAKYAEYVDVAATEFMRAVWGNYQDMLQKGIDNQVVNLSLSWKSPAAFDDVLAIEVTTAHIGNSSYTLAFKIYNHTSGVDIATAEVVYVMVSVKEYSKIAIPSDFRQKLDQGAIGILIDHAGV